MKDRFAKAAATEAIQAFEKAAAENYEAAKQKRAAKQTVLDNIKLLTDAREQLDEEWIDKLFARGAEAAASWRGIGATGDYRATDWDWMKDNVIDRGLDALVGGGQGAVRPALRRALPDVHRGEHQGLRPADRQPGHPRRVHRGAGDHLRVAQGPARQREGLRGGPGRLRLQTDGQGVAGARIGDDQGRLGDALREDEGRR